MAKVVSEYVGARENGARTWDAWKCFPARPKNKLWRRPLWIGRLCWGGGTKLELATKAWARKKNYSYTFF